MKSHLAPSVAGLALCLAAVASALPAGALTPAEATGVLYLKQEEKLARDVYQVLAARWDQAVFRNLAAAEQRHLDAVNLLIARYDLADPAPAEPGRFSIPELQSLYDQLLVRGQGSLIGRSRPASSSKRRTLQTSGKWRRRRPRPPSSESWRICSALRSGTSRR